jgi:hypothetical protein
MLPLPRERFSASVDPNERATDLLSPLFEGARRSEGRVAWDTVYGER